MAGENERRILQRDSDPHLFRPLALRAITVRNRIMLSPMCQYSAEDGVPNLWHVQHLCARAAGGAGIVCTEVTHVEPRGRITKHCLGLWNDAQRDAFAPIAAFVAQQGAVPGIQLGHAGRKASVSRPWEGSRPLTPEQGAWRTVGPSTLPHGDSPPPHALSQAEIDDVLAAFAAATRRAREAGFKFLELHAAHGYLAHQFLSPLASGRTDAYGGDPERRARFLHRMVEAVRTEWPSELPLSVRLSCSDWVEGGFGADDAVATAVALKARGDVDLIDCSSGGVDPRQRIPIHPGYQVGFAERIRREAGIATAAVGLISAPEMAEEIVANGRADIVVLGRALLGDPMWPLRAAKALQARKVAWPVQYERGSIY